MTMSYDPLAYEMPWRPNYEKNAVAGWLAASGAALAVEQVSTMPPEPHRMRAHYGCYPFLSIVTISVCYFLMLTYTIHLCLFLGRWNDAPATPYR